jgi:hypothetical protein
MHQLQLMLLNLDFARVGSPCLPRHSLLALKRLKRPEHLRPTPPQPRSTSACTHKLDPFGTAPPDIVALGSARTRNSPKADGPSERERDGLRESRVVAY